MSDLVAILLALVLLGLNAFFVGAEFALISARRTQIEPRAAGGSRMARRTLRAMESVSLVMAAAQLGITVCSLGLGAVGEPAVAHLIEPVIRAVGLPDGLLHPIAFVVAMSVVVYLHVVVGEMVPKNIALAGPDRAALLLGPPMLAIVVVLKPLVVALNHIANGAVRLMRVQPRDEVSTAYTHEEVAGIVDESRREGMLEPAKYDLLAGALDFTDRTVMSVLLPSRDLATVERGAPIAVVEDACAETGFSRFPVTNADGELAGYTHIKDVLEVDPGRRDRTLADKWVHPLATVRRTDPLHDALATMRRRGAHLARVVEDDGNVLGVVALEDVLEELVGEIRDATQTPGSPDPHG